MAINNAKLLLVDRAIDPNDSKNKVWGPVWTALGFTFDMTNNWCVYPKRKALLKLYYRLVVEIPLDSLSESIKTVWETNRLISLSHLLQWYSIVIPSGKSFVQSLFNCTNNKGRLSELSNEAKIDLLWWRSIIEMAARNPSLIARGIETLSKKAFVMWTVISDASTSIGGGVWLTRHIDSGDVVDWDFTRWNKCEILRHGISIHDSGGISINFFRIFHDSVWCHQVV